MHGGSAEETGHSLGLFLQNMAAGERQTKSRPVLATLQTYVQFVSICSNVSLTQNFPNLCLPVPCRPATTGFRIESWAHRRNSTGLEIFMQVYLCVIIQFISRHTPQTSIYNYIYINTYYISLLCIYSIMIIVTYSISVNV